MTSGIKIKEMRVTPVAIADPPLRSSYGLHQPYALRNILDFESEVGVIGVSVAFMLVLVLVVMMQLLIL